MSTYISISHFSHFDERVTAFAAEVTEPDAFNELKNVPGPEVRLSEQDLYIGQNIDANKYVYSKFKVEELVLDAIAHHELNAKIMRVGNLSARQKDGEFQINFNSSRPWRR